MLCSLRTFSTKVAGIKLSSKQQMVDMCQQAFLYRKRSASHLPDALVEQYSALLAISVKETRQCIHALSHLIKSAMFQGSSEAQDIFDLFPNNFHKNLRDLLTKIILDNMASWRADAVNTQVSLARLTDFDWRVDTKTSSDSVARMAVPTCLLNLQIQERAEHINETPGMSNLNVELSKETLETMLDGLGKIRDQLASVASR